MSASLTINRHRPLSSPPLLLLLLLLLASPSLSCLEFLSPSANFTTVAIPAGLSTIEITVKISLSPSCSSSSSSSSPSPLSVILTIDKVQSIVESFGESGVAVVFAGGVFPGSHLLEASLVRGGGEVHSKDAAYAVFDVLPAFNPPPFPPPPPSLRSPSPSSPPPSPSCTSSSCARGITVAFLDSVPTSSIDGQRKIWLDQAGHLSSLPHFSVKHLLLGDWEEGSEYLEALKRGGGEVAVQVGHIVDSDEAAETIAASFRSVDSFLSLSPPLQTAFRSLHTSLLAVDVLVYMSTGAERSAHDHYLPSLARLSSTLSVLEVPVPTPPDRARLHSAVTAVVAPSGYAASIMEGSGLRAVVIHPGADEALAAAAKSGGSEGQFVVLAVARMDPDKVRFWAYEAGRLLLDVEVFSLCPLSRSVVLSCPSLCPVGRHVSPIFQLRALSLRPPLLSFPRSPLPLHAVGADRSQSSPGGLSGERNERRRTTPSFCHHFFVPPLLPNSRFLRALFYFCEP